MYVRKYGKISDNNNNTTVNVIIIIMIEEEFDNMIVGNNDDNKSLASGMWLFESSSDANSTLFDS